MAILAQQTIVGNVGNVYDLRTVGKNNTPVIDFSVAVTPRKKNGEEWVDGETYWLNITAWNRLAENVAESFNSGDRVILVGRTEMKDGYTNKKGEAVPPRAILIADFAGLEVSYASATSNRVPGGNRAQKNERPPAAKPAAAAPAPAEVDDDIFADGDLDFETPF